jgi:hypothetical protein
MAFTYMTNGKTETGHKYLRTQNKAWPVFFSRLGRRPRDSHGFQDMIWCMSPEWSPSGFLLTGRCAIVTGCARGLGRSLAHGLAAAEARVLACDEHCLASLRPRDRFEAKSRIRHGKTPGRSVWACCAFAQSSYLHHEVIPFRHARRPTGCNSIVSDRVLMVTGHFQ